MKNLEVIRKFLEEQQDEILSTNDVAKVLNKSSRMVLYMANCNKLQSLKTKSGIRIYLRSEVEKMLAA